MDSYTAISLFIIVFSLLSGVIIVSLQFAAYRRHRHVSFLLLVQSSVIAIAYCALAGLPFLTAKTAAWWIPINAVSAILVVASTTLGIAGIVLLFRAFRHLSEDNASAQARIAHLEAQLPGAAAPAPPTSPHLHD